MERRSDQGSIRRLIYAAFFMALGLVLPFLTGQIPEIGKLLSPMHIPILLCGFVCGWRYGGVVGFITPLLRSVLFGIPVLYPNAIGMAFELMTYGIVAGALYSMCRKKDILRVYLCLIVAMFTGRLVWGVASLILYGVAGNSFTWSMFITGAFLGAIPGIILHLIIIPPIVLSVERYRRRS